MDCKMVHLRFGDRSSNLPAWARDIYHDESTGDFFISSVAVPSDAFIDYQMKHPDEFAEVVEVDGWKYIPLSLAVRMCPDRAAWFAQVEKHLRQVVAELQSTPQTVAGWLVQ